MFEKIFGIFRKKSKADLSAEIPGDADDMFDIGDTGMDGDFDADTISLETGMSDGGFSDSSGVDLADSEPEFGDSFADADSVADDMGVGTLDLDEETPPDAIADLEEPLTPVPEVEPLGEEPFAAPKPKKSKKALLVTVAVVIVGFVVGFVIAAPASIESIRRATSSEPTVLEQLAVVRVENAELNKNLEIYHSVGTMKEIIAIKAELKRREEISTDLERLEAKISDRPAVEERLESAGVRLKEVQRTLVIQEGTLANAQKSLKQIEARNHYLVSSTEANLEQIETSAAKSEELKARLDEERIKEAEAAAMLTRDVQQGVQQTAFEALSQL